MPSFSGAALGIGGEAPFAEKGRQQRRKEGFEDLDAKLAIEQAVQNRKRTDIQEKGVQERIAALQRLLKKDEGWKSKGNPINVNGQLYQEQTNEAGESRLIPVQQPEGVKAPTKADEAGAATGAKKNASLDAYNKAKEAGIPDTILDRIWPPADRLQWMNTPEGITGFHKTTAGEAEGGPVKSGVKGWPPGYGSNAPPPQGPLDETDMGYVDQLAKGQMTLDQLKKVYGGKLEYKLKPIVAAAIKNGFDPNSQLTGVAGQNIATAQAQIDINKPLVELIDGLGLTNNNTPGYLAVARLKYGAGANTPGGLADEIANLQLTGITSAAAALKGSSRSWAALSVALQHTPNVWVDSPANIRKKLTTINQRLQAVIDEQKQYGTKSGLPRSQQKIDMNRVTGTVEIPGKGKVNVGAPTSKPPAQPQ